MKIIIPMAGRGSRLRPHTLTVPKPLIPIAGKPIVERLAEDIMTISNEKVDEIAFITGDFGEEVDEQLIQIATRLGAKGTVFKQEEPLGTAHAIYCAKSCLEGPVIIAFADTLFQAKFELKTENDGIIWVKQVKDPSAFGVVKLDKNGIITDFVEKPQEFVSDLAIIGIYYFKNGETLKKEIEYLLDNKILSKGEYQLTDALENMKAKNMKFSSVAVDQWMDCGTKTVTILTNSKILDIKKDELSVPNSAQIINSLIVKPCYIGENVVIENSKIGPNVSIGNNSTVKNSNIDNSLIQDNTQIVDGNLTYSMIGNHAVYYGVSRSLSIGDYSILDFQNK